MDVCGVVVFCLCGLVLVLLGGYVCDVVDRCVVFVDEL